MLPNPILPFCHYVQPHLRTPRACPLENIHQKAHEIAISDQDGTSKTQATDDNTPLSGRSFGRRSASSATSRRIPHTLLLLLATRRESPSARQRCPIRMKTIRQERLAWGRIHFRNRPGWPLLPPHMRYKERTPSLEIGTGPIQPETRWSSQLEAKTSMSLLTATPNHDD